jgi:hypothetical protein
MKSNRHMIENLTRNDVKFYETKLNTVSRKHAKKKVNQQDFVVPCISEYNHIITFDFNVSQLRMMSKKYGLKISGNKNELNKRIYLYLLYNHRAIQIQRSVRRKFVYKYLKLHGPVSVIVDRSLCVNECDFLSLEKIVDIGYVNFFSVMDFGRVYGFDVVSLFNFMKIEKSEGKKFRNPFTNCEFSCDRIYHMVKRFIKLSDIIGTGLNVNSIDEENRNNTITDDFEYKVIQLFHYIDSLGNYTKHEWFMNLNRPKLIKFIRELVDIWTYRAELTDQARRNICFPGGDPFICRRVGRPLIFINDTIPTEVIRIRAFFIMENMVRCSINDENSAIGCYYLLGALTLVSDETADALPWLFQCMFHG